MTNHEYLKNELDLFKQKYNPENYFISNQKRDDDIKQIWKETQAYWQREYQNMNSKEQIFSSLDSFKITVERIAEDRKHWNHFQRTDMMQQLYLVVASISKAITCFNNSNCKFKFTKTEIEGLFSELKLVAEKMDNTNMIRMMQD